MRASWQYSCRSVCGRTEKFWCLIKLNELWFSLCTDGSRLELLANLVSDNYRLNILDATLAIKRKLLNSFPGESPNLIAPCDQILFSFVWNYGESPLETLMKHLFQLDTQMWVRFESWAYEKRFLCFQQIYTNRFNRLLRSTLFGGRPLKFGLRAWNSVHVLSECKADLLPKSRSLVKIKVQLIGTVHCSSIWAAIRVRIGELKLKYLKLFN